MNIAPLLLRLYPRAWRERYGEEFLALVGDRLEWRDAMDIGKSAVSERLAWPGLFGRLRLARLAGGLAAAWIACVFVIGMIRMAMVLQHLSPGAAASDAWFTASVWSSRSVGGLAVAALLAVLAAVVVNGTGMARDHRRGSGLLVKFAPAIAMASLQLMAAPKLSRISPVAWESLVVFDLSIIAIGCAVYWALFADTPGGSTPSQDEAHFE